MKKRTVTKLLSCMLAFSMVATAAPVTAWADEVPAAEEELENSLSLTTRKKQRFKKTQKKCKRISKRMQW